MDHVDRKIIGRLQEDSRISVTDLAESIPLSLSATSERLKRLIASGLIKRFTIELDPASAGRDIGAIVDVRLRLDADTEAFDRALIEMTAVVSAMHLTGRFDYQLQVATRDVAELDDLLGALKREFGAEETNTRLILRTIDGLPRPLPLV